MKKYLALIAACAISLTACSNDNSQTTVTVTESADPSAQEADRDETFLAQFRMITAMDDLTRQEALKLAHSTCTAMEVGNKVEILGVLQDRYGTSAATEFMVLSASVYCRDQLTP